MNNYEKIESIVTLLFLMGIIVYLVGFLLIRNPLSSVFSFTTTLISLMLFAIAAAISSKFFDFRITVVLMIFIAGSAFGVAIFVYHFINPSFFTPTLSTPTQISNTAKIGEILAFLWAFAIAMWIIVMYSIYLSKAETKKGMRLIAKLKKEKLFQLSAIPNLVLSTFFFSIFLGALNVASVSVSISWSQGAFVLIALFGLFHFAFKAIGW